MLGVGTKEATVYVGTHAVAAIYKGAVLVWEAVSSCFGSGGWDNQRGWSNQEGWKN